MMRTAAILGVLLAQTMSVCGPGTMVVCVHQGGRSHIELAGGACCHEDAGTASSHAHCRHACTGRAICGHQLQAAAHECEHSRGLSVCHRGDDGACEDSDSCTDYPLVISQLRAEQPRSATLAADFYQAFSATLWPARSGLPQVCSGLGANTSGLSSPVLAALSTVVLRC
jgi:hypothetical protein